AGFRLDDPAQARTIIGEAFKIPGPALIEAVIDPHEPPMPGHITSTQAWNFTESMMRGDKDRWNIIKTMVENKIRRIFIFFILAIGAASLCFARSSSSAPAVRGSSVVTTATSSGGSSSMGIGNAASSGGF